MLNTIFIQSDTKIMYAISTDTSIYIQNKWTTVVSVFHDIFVSGLVG